MNKRNFRQASIMVVLLLIAMISVTGCNSPPVQTSPTTTPTNTSTTPTTQVTQIPPTQPIYVEVSFPDGAPPLGQTAELRCVIKTYNIQTRDFTLTVTLPDGLELKSGNLSWQGIVTANTEIIAIKATVQSIKIGNYSVDVRGVIDPENKYEMIGNVWYPIYLSITDNSAKWGINPPWLEGPPTTVPPTKSTQKMPFSSLG